jgi:hypothetical protein
VFVFYKLQKYGIKYVYIHNANVKLHMLPWGSCIHSSPSSLKTQWTFHVYHHHHHLFAFTIQTMCGTQDHLKILYPLICPACLEGKPCLVPGLIRQGLVSESGHYKVQPTAPLPQCARSSKLLGIWIPASQHNKSRLSSRDPSVSTNTPTTILIYMGRGN